MRNPELRQASLIRTGIQLLWTPLKSCSFYNPLLFATPGMPEALPYSPGGFCSKLR